MIIMYHPIQNHKLRVAARDGDMEKAKEALRKGGNPNARNMLQMNAVTYSMAWEHPELTKLLHDNGGHRHSKKDAEIAAERFDTDKYGRLRVN
jgi:hypothetical protein